MKRLVIMGCVAYLVVGLGLIVLGTVMEPMVDAYGVKYGDGGQLVMHQFFGSMLGVVLTPWLMGRLGKKPLLLAALAIVVVAETLYALQPSWGVMLVAAPFAGIGLGMTEVIVGSLVIAAAQGNANVAMSRIELFFGVGALLMPFAGAALISSGHWASSFVVVGALAALTLLLWVLFWPKIVDAPRVEASEAQKRAVYGRNRSQVLTVLGAISLFFAVYVGFEMCFVHYLPSLLVNNNGLSESTASLSLSVFWGAMVLGRLVSGQAADRWGGGAYMIVTCVSAAVIFALMGGFESTWAMFALTLLAGLAMSGMFAIALVFANRVLPGATEKTTSLLIASGGVGGALLPKLTGWFLDEYGTDATRWLFAGIAVVMLAVILWVLVAARSLEREVSGQPVTE